MVSKRNAYKRKVTLKVKIPRGFDISQVSSGFFDRTFLAYKLHSFTKALVHAVEVPVVASGGINEIADIKKLNEMDVVAAIIGRSLYEGTLNLSDAINAAK